MMKPKTWKKIFSISLIVYFIAIIVLAILPGVVESGALIASDKVWHFAEFFIFGILLLLTSFFFELHDKYLTCFVIAMFAILVSEIVQIPVAGRTFSVKDMIADMAGIGLSFLIIYVLDKSKWKFFKQLYSESYKE